VSTRLTKAWVGVGGWGWGVCERGGCCSGGAEVGVGVGVGGVGVWVWVWGGGGEGVGRVLRGCCSGWVGMEVAKGGGGCCLGLAVGRGLRGVLETCRRSDGRVEEIVQLKQPSNAKCRVQSTVRIAAHLVGSCCHHHFIL